MKFGEAIEHARMGKKIAREGWNGKNMYVYMTKGDTIPVEDWVEKLPSQVLTNTERKRGHVIVKPHLDMMNAQDERIIGWSATQSDMLADDWYVVE